MNRPRSCRPSFGAPLSRRPGPQPRLVRRSDTAYQREDSMPRPLRLDPDRLLPPEPGIGAIARELYASVKDLPIISPHGHTDPAWFATNEPWTNAAELLLAPDHYLYRMLFS